MQEEFKHIAEHMQGLGLAALAHANHHAIFWEPMNDHWADLAVLQAAHAAEILIKAKIAEEHPLLVFSTLPRRSQASGDILRADHLFQFGRTYEFKDLPDRLWACTGCKLKNEDRYQEFGRLRNTIQHFATDRSKDLGYETLDFIYKVIDPFINSCWGLFAVDFHEDQSGGSQYVMEGLLTKGIKFLVPDEGKDMVKYLRRELRRRGEI